MQYLTEQNLELSKELLERQGTINELKAEVERLTSRNARLEELFQERVENRRWMVGELRRHNSQRGKLMEFLDLHENSEDLSRWAQTEIRVIFDGEIDESSVNAVDEIPHPCQPIGCDNGYHLTGCVFAEVDAELADINRRVAADKAVIEAAKALRAATTAFEATRMDAEQDALWAAADALAEAVDALVEVEDTPQPADSRQTLEPTVDTKTSFVLGPDAYVPAGATADTPTCPTCCAHDHRAAAQAAPQPAPSNSQPWEQGPYRVGRHQAHNIYRVTEQHPEGVQIGCMFNAADGPLVVAALNATVGGA